MSGIRFIDPPSSLYRKRPEIDPGLLALAGAVLAALFVVMLFTMLAAGVA